MQPRDWMQSPTHAKVNVHQIRFWRHDSALFLSLHTNLNSKKRSEFSSNAFQYISGCDLPLCAKLHFQNVFFKCIFLTDWSHIWAGFFFLSTVHDWSSVWAIHWAISEKQLFKEILLQARATSDFGFEIFRPPDKIQGCKFDENFLSSIL